MSSNVLPSLEELRAGLQLACQPQSVVNIERGRSQVAALPRDWVLANVDRAADESLDLSDYWEYRRLLELLELIGATDSIKRLVSTGLLSHDEDIREAAEDWQART